MTGEEIILKRDCEAVLIPAGNKITLHSGEPVTITQALGGSYTVIIHGNMARIEAKDADALGKEIVKTEKAQPTGPLAEETVMNILRTCFDPEIPVNIVDLGLVYDVQISPLPEGTHHVEVKMTLTAPGCGMGPVLAQDVQNKLISLEPIDEANVELVWDPPWNQSMMTEAAKLQLGLM
jgi:probable FeS assembly SUF system protein SufT